MWCFTMYRVVCHRVLGSAWVYCVAFQGVLHFPTPTSVVYDGEGFWGCSVSRCVLGDISGCMYGAVFQGMCTVRCFRVYTVW